MNIRKNLKQLVALAAVGLMTSLSIVHADEPAPVIISETAAAAAQADGIGESTNSAAFPTFYFSAPGNGNVAGWGYADEDIMRYNSGTGAWSKAFDGTDNGLPAAADIDALTMIVNSGYISYLMSFDNPTAVPGLGTVDDSDVVRFDTWNSAWSMYLDGSTVGLTTNAEDIDGLTFSSGNMLVVSTSGNFKVKDMSGGNMAGKKGDLIILVDKAAGTWTKWLTGTQFGIQTTNNINAVAFVRYNESFVKDARYIVTAKNWKFPNGTAIGANDVSEQVWFQNGHVEYGQRLDNKTIGFVKIDALEVVK